MIEVREKLKNWIKDTLEVETSVTLEHPDNVEHGDYSTNIAMILAKQEGKNPAELAKIFVEKLGAQKISEVERMESVGGFINFFLKVDTFVSALQQINEGKGLPQNLKGQKYFIEHTQPNPFKELHIGHLMNNTIGESLCRLTKTLGAEIKTATYHGDVGLHVAKAVWALMEGDQPLEHAYAFGNNAYEEDEKAREQIIEINKRIYDKSDAAVNSVYQDGREKSLDNFENIYKKLDSNFDFHFYESEAGEVGKLIVLENTPKVFEESEGAVVFRGENFEPKTHTRVFLNKDKLPTYEAKEVGLAKIKNEKFDYDTSITVTANEQDSFFDVVEVAIGEVMPDRKGKLRHVSHGLLKLPEGKMSSRTGNVISALGLIDQVKEKVKEKMVERDFDEKERESVAEIVGISAIKYSILRQAIGKDIIFDLEKSLSFEGDSGPYLQYSAVRASSVLAKAKEEGVELSAQQLGGWQTIKLEKLLARFYEVIERSALDYAPQVMVTYLTEVAGEFNSFYANNKIVDGEDEASPYKLFITKAFYEVMASGLWLLGIKTPEKM